jgi:hypothetical protein
MKSDSRPVAVCALALAASVGQFPGGLCAPSANWSKIPTTTVTLFYPGQSSYEWLLSSDHKDADTEIAEGESCVSCHEGEEEEIAMVKAGGGFLDLLQWRAQRSNPVGMADDFYVLEYRLQDAGKGPFSKNEDRATHQPRFMYDEKKYGSRSITTDRIRKQPVVLVREQNAAPFDPNAGWKEGDLIPKYLISREDAAGSAADNESARRVWRDGMWTVVWARKLNQTNDDNKPLKQGGVYTFGFLVHDDHIAGRGHHVSFPLTIGFGAKADIEATKLP